MHRVTQTPADFLFCSFPTAGDDEEGAGTAAGVWKEAGVLDDDTTDDDSVGGANTKAKGTKTCVRVWYHVIDELILFVE